MRAATGNPLRRSGSRARARARGQNGRAPRGSPPRHRSRPAPSRHGSSRGRSCACPAPSARRATRAPRRGRSRCSPTPAVPARGPWRSIAADAGMCGSTTHSTATAVTAASAALPPRAASRWRRGSPADAMAAMPSQAMTGERPGSWKSRHGCRAVTLCDGRHGRQQGRDAMTLTLAQARTILDKTLAAARERSSPLGVAVVDGRGRCAPTPRRTATRSCGRGSRPARPSARSRSAPDRGACTRSASSARTWRPRWSR